MKWTCALASLLFLGSAAHAALSADARSRLRFRLENLSSDVELALRNHASDEIDFKLQNRRARALKLGERIPDQPRAREIYRQLERSAVESGIGVSEFRVTAIDAAEPALPRSVRIGEDSFRLHPDEVGGTVRFRFIARAGRSALAKWMGRWRESMRRLVNPDGPVRATGARSWEVHGVAYCFRQLRLPELRFADPRILLPDWARADPKRFAREEPALWSLLQKTERTIPRATPLLKLRRAFMLQDARIGYFLLNAGAPPEVRIN